MTKFLLLVLLIVAVLWGPLSRLRKPARRPSPQDAAPPGAASADNTPATAAQDMVPCAHCRVHLPRGDALPGPEHGRGLVFCCAEHRRLGPGHGTD